MSSIQDLGRWGYQHHGVPVAGAMDKISASLANIILGNDENEAVIEMTLHGTTMIFNEATTCALVGGGCKAYIDDVELSFNRLLHISPNSILTTKPDSKGCRTYLSIEGGFEISKKLGSASTYVPSGIGGLKGRNLITGDILYFKKKERRTPVSSLKMPNYNFYISQWQIPDYNQYEEKTIKIHILRGPEFDLFQPMSMELLLNTTFIISAQSNRMGYRLMGEKLVLKEKTEIVSTPVTAGIIQITHDGSPIILMADAQTTGGYPRIARVCSADINLLAQLRPGKGIRLCEISEKESADRCNELRIRINNLKSVIGMSIEMNKRSIK